MDYDIELEIAHIRANLKDRGYETKVTYCKNLDGELISFTIEIIGRLA